MTDKLKPFIAQKKYILLIFVIFALAASIQSLVSGTKTYGEGGPSYNRYNNYTIFEKSFYHLKNDQDLYILYPEEHWDLYKYTPTFAAVFGVIAIFPDWIGLNLWNLLNALVLCFAVYYLPKLDHYKKGLVLLIVLIELMTSMQNEQSNGLIAGLLIFTFGLLEHRKYALACLCIVFSAYIKLFGIVGFALFLFYPQKWKLILYTILWTIVLFLLPLLFVDIRQYEALFVSYYKMLSNDHSISLGFSVMGWLYTWFGISINKLIIVLMGVVTFLVPLVRFKMYQHYLFRLLSLCSVLLWVIIFNHKAESPTFIIAMSGVALWFIHSEKSTLNKVLFASAFVLTTLSPTDIFPRYLRNEFVVPYVLKAVPCIFIWFKIIYDMMVLKMDKENYHLTIN